MADKWLLEDGVSGWLLEDGVSYWLLDAPLAGYSDGAYYGTGVPTYSGNTATVVATHTGGANNVACIFVHYGSGGTVTGVTFDGAAATVVTVSQSGGVPSGIVAYAPCSSSGSHTWVVTLSAAFPVGGAQGTTVTMTGVTSTPSQTAVQAWGTYSPETTGSITVSAGGIAMTFLATSSTGGTWNGATEITTTNASFPLAYSAASTTVSYAVPGSGSQMATLSWDAAATSNAISGASSLSFTPSATLLGQGAVSASSALAFSPSATLLGTGAISGSSALAFSPSGTVNGLIIGTSTLLLSPSATLLGAGAISGTSTVVFAPSATLLGTGAVSGSSTLTLSPSSTLLGKGAVVGSSTIVFTPSATLFVANGISGSSSLTFGCSGTLLGAGTLLGSTALSLSAAATPIGTGQLQGASGLSFAGSAALLGHGQIAGSTSFSLTIAGQLVFGLSGQVKVQILDAEQAKPVKVWSGTGWVTKPLKFWTGTAWRATSY